MVYLISILGYCQLAFKKLNLDKRLIILYLQVVANKPVHVIAKPVVIHLRLPLLSPEELKTVEEENEKDGLIPVGTNSYYKSRKIKSK